MSFSQMELNGLNLAVSMFNDTKYTRDNMHVSFKMEKITLDDTRQSDRHIRLVFLLNMF